ncbi:MAG: PIN domain-containing protein [Nitrospinota bacterium]
MIYLDTHVVAWLYAGKVDLIPKKVQNRISKEELLMSPIVTLELQYLFEIGRVSEQGSDVIQDLEKRIGLMICELPFNVVINCSVKQKWTRDPFDRIIVAQASLHASKLITRDETILRNYKHALWG